MIKVEQLSIGSLVFLDGVVSEVVAMNEKVVILKQGKHIETVTIQEGQCHWLFPIELTEDVLSRIVKPKLTEKSIVYKVSNLLRYTFVKKGRYKGRIYKNIGSKINIENKKTLGALHELQSFLISFEGVVINFGRKKSAK